MRRSCCSMKPRARSTRNRSAWFRTLSPLSCRAARRLSSRTGSRRFARPTSSSSWKRDESPKPEPTTRSWRGADSTRACSGSRLWRTRRSRWPLLAAHDPVDEKVRPKPRFEIALERVRVVDALGPFEKGEAPSLALRPVKFQEGVEDAGLGEAEVAVARRELRHRLGGAAAFVQEKVERREQPGPVGARLAVHERRVAQAVVDEGDPVPVARFLLERPRAVLAPPAQVDDGAHPLRRKPSDLMRRGLCRAPQTPRDPVPVEVGQAENAVIGEKHVGPCSEPARWAL